MTFDPTNPTPGVYRDVPASDYFAARAVNASLLKCIARKSPAHAALMLDQMYGHGGTETSKAMEFGDSCHAALLEPERFEEQYVVAGGCSLTTAKGEQCTRTGVRRFSPEGVHMWVCQQHSKSVESAGAPETTPDNVVTPADRERLVTICRNVWEHPAAGKLLRRATDAELTIVWQDADTGLICKARLDAWCDRDGILLDLKTTRSCRHRDFNRSAFDLGYPIQVAHYVNGIRASGLSPRGADAYVIAVESDAPHVVEIFDFDEVMQDGQADAEAAMQRYVECRENDDWPGYSDGIEAVPLTVPAWKSAAF